MVPKWFLGFQFQKEARSTMVPVVSALVLFWGIWILGKDSLWMVLDLTAFTNSEGIWAYAAVSRARGDFGVLPFLGIYPPHLWLMFFLEGEALESILLLRTVGLFSIASLSCLLYLEAGFRSASKLSAMLLGMLLLLWSQNSSNSWNPLVPGIFLFLVGVIFHRKESYKFSLLFFLLAAVFDFRLFAAGLIYQFITALNEKRGRNSSYLLLIAFLCLNLLQGFSHGILETLLLWRSFFLDSFQQSLVLVDTKILGAPLSVFGTWILSFYFWKAKVNYRIAAMLAVVAYLAISVFREGSLFVFGSIFWLPVFLVIGLSVLHFSIKPKDPELFELIVLTALMSLCFFPLGQISNAMAIFPFFLLVLVRLLKRIADLYPKIWAVWWHFPLLLFLFGGVAQQARSIFLFHSSKENSWGLKSAGAVDSWMNEAASLKAMMESSGWKPQEEVEIVPENFALRAFWGYAYPRTGKPLYRIRVHSGTFEISKFNN